MECPACEGADLVHGVRDLPYGYNGETTTIPMVRGDTCSDCGETVLEVGESVREGVAMLELNKAVGCGR